MNDMNELTLEALKVERNAMFRGFIYSVIGVVLTIWGMTTVEFTRHPFIVVIIGFCGGNLIRSAELAWKKWLKLSGAVLARTQVDDALQKLK